VGSLPVLDVLFDKKWKERPNVDGTQIFGWTAIVEACRNSHYHIVERLVELGATVDVEDLDGEIPLDHATQPWIIGLLQDRMKYGSEKGPRDYIREALGKSKGQSSKERSAKLIETAKDLISR